jgi:hypothetical protein
VPVRVLVESEVFGDINAYDRVLNHLAYMGFSHIVEVAYDPEIKVETCLAIHDTCHEFAYACSGEWTSFYSHGHKAVMMVFVEERDAFTLRLFFG